MARLGPGDQIGAFVIDEALPEGSGGMATVYRAHHRDRPQEVIALKVANPDPEDNECIKNEADHLEALQVPYPHPNIVRIYPVVQARHAEYSAKALNLPGNPWYFAMEFLTGGSLRAYLHRRRRLDVEEAVEIAVQIANALAHIHGQRDPLVHLDIKPENILFRYPLSQNPRPQAVLVDFGIARRRWQRQLPVGSLPYLSPEYIHMVRDEGGQVTDRSDVYSLGAVLYEMLAGAPAFSGSRSTISSDILTRYPKPLSEQNPAVQYYPSLEQLVMQTLDKYAPRRPAARDLAIQLDHIVPPHVRERYYAQKQPEAKSGSGMLSNLADHVKSLVGCRATILAVGLLAGLCLAAVLGGAIWLLAGRPGLPPPPTATVRPTARPPTQTVITASPAPTRSATALPHTSTPVTLTPTFTPRPTHTPTRPPSGSATPTPTSIR